MNILLTGHSGFIGKNLLSLLSKDKKKHKIIGTLNNTDKIMNDTFWVGIHPALSEDMLSFVSEVMHEALRR